MQKLLYPVSGWWVAADGLFEESGFNSHDDAVNWLCGYAEGPPSSVTDMFGHVVLVIKDGKPTFDYVSMDDLLERAGEADADVASYAADVNAMNWGR